jgi:DNA-binding IclR family transcriptional regulator
MNTTTYANAAQVRLLDVLEALCGYVVRGASNADLAKAVNTTPSAVTRDMAQLIEKGWARKDAVTGRFHVTAHFTRLTFAVLGDFDSAKRRLDEQFSNHTSAER